MITALSLIGIYLIGVMFGVVLTYLWMGKPVRAGRFDITYGDPEKDLIRIDLEKDLPEIEKAKSISFQVNVIHGNNDNRKPLNK